MQARAPIGILIVCAVVFALFVHTGSVTTLLRTENTTEVLGGVLPFEVSADAFALYDLTEDRYVYEQDVNTSYSIASLTKLFTAYAAYTSPVFDVAGSITPSDIETEGRAGSLQVGQQYTPRELLFPLLLLSSNDAGAAIERLIGREHFNNAVQGLIANASLVQTNIVESSGLRIENTATVRDMVSLLAYLYRETPYLLDITTLSAYQGEYAGWLNNNPGFLIEGWSGGKQGYLPEVGYTFAGLYERDHVYVVVLLGSESIQKDVEVLLEQVK